MIHENVLHTIGNTPMVRINRLNKNPRVTVAAKLEGTNPGGSIKDRIAHYIIEKAEKSGQLTRDKIILEATSGNTGIGLALVAAIKGYRLMITMSECMSLERRRTLEALGAEIILTPGDKGTDGAIEKAAELYAQNPDLYCLPNQYDNEDNYMAHYYTTANEIWEQTNGRVTHFVAGMGTTGTLMGISRRLKELNPDIQIIGVEPTLNHKIQGLKNMQEARVPGIYDPSRLDRKIVVADEDAFEMARRLAAEEGIFTGISAGAAMYAAIKLASSLDKGLIVTMIPDRGEKYLSTDLFCCKPCHNTNKSPNCIYGPEKK